MQQSNKISDVWIATWPQRETLEEQNIYSGSQNQVLMLICKVFTTWLGFHAVGTIRRNDEKLREKAISVNFKIELSLYNNWILTNLISCEMGTPIYLLLQPSPNSHTAHTVGAWV